MDDASEERGLFARTAADRPVYLAAALGVAVAHVADDRVGEFGIVRRCSPRDVAAGGDGVAVATADDVLLDPAATGEGTALRPTDFGPAEAVGLDADGTLTAVAPSGSVAQRGPDDGTWADRGRVTTAVHAVDPPFLASDDGVLQVGPDGLRNVGLVDVRDVSTAGVPRAATATGLYHLGNGWMDELPGSFDRVAGRATAGDILAVAAGTDGLFAAIDGDWEPVAVPVTEPIADVGVAGGPLAVTESGCLLLAGPDGLRPFELGLPDVRGLAVP